MEQIDNKAAPSAAPAGVVGREAGPSPRFHHPHFAPQFEAEIGQLYLRTQDEPVPLRLLTILRAGLCGSKA